MKPIYTDSKLSLRFIISTFVLILFTSLGTLHAQSFDSGLELYKQGKYSEAAKVFNSLDSNRAYLFSGKTYFALGNYLASKGYLRKIDENAERDIYQEAQYNLALADFQLANYGSALNRLYPFYNLESETQLVMNARKLYKDILPFLTLNQRKNAFQEADFPQIQYDLVSSAFGRVEYPVAKMLLDQLKKSTTGISSQDIQNLARMVTDSVTYSNRKINSGIRAPNDITYNIGAALPSYKTGAPEYEVARGLYYGYVLAAEEFNSQNMDKKAFIRYQNTSAKSDSAAYSMTEFAWARNTDIVLGPLFSDAAKQMGELAEMYQIPLIPPLANADELGRDNPYFFQINPPFSSHGKRMAEYAINTLQMDTLAIITEKGSSGEASAYAFKDRAARLGAHISYFFVEDFSSQGFDLTDYTKYFTSDSANIDSLNIDSIDGIYAPFTGQAGPTLAELLFVDLEAMNSKLPILGSQVWGNLKIPEDQMGNRKIYFSESHYMDSNNPEVKQFRKAYRDRFGIDPNRFSMIGYDTANFVLNALREAENPALLKEALKNQPMFNGLMSNISFDGTRVNQQIKIFTIGDQGIRPAGNN